VRGLCRRECRFDQAGLLGGGLQALTGLATTPVFQSARRRLGLPTDTWGETSIDKLKLPEMSRQILERLLNLVPSWPLLPLGILGLLLLIMNIPAKSRVESSTQRNLCRPRPSTPG
jgi:hypothetical protein